GGGRATKRSSRGGGGGGASSGGASGARASSTGGCSGSGLQGTKPAAGGAAVAGGGAAGAASDSVALRLRLRCTESDAAPGCGVASRFSSGAFGSLGWGRRGDGSDMGHLPFCGGQPAWWEEAIHPLNSASKAAGLLERGTLHDLGWLEVDIAQALDVSKRTV